MAPYGKNLLRPCPIIDHPSVMKTAVARNNAYPTHEGAEELFTELHPGLIEYSAEVGRVLDPVWEKETWTHTWLESDPDYQRRLTREGDADELPDEAGALEADQVGACS